MRNTTVLATLILAACATTVSAGSPQTTATMKISGMPGQIAIPVDQTDWSQIPGLPDPTAPRDSQSTNPLGSRSSSLISRSGTLGGGGGGGGGGGRVEVQDISIVKELDHSSPRLLTACANGEHIPVIEIEFVSVGGDDQEYLVLTLKNCIVAAYNPQGTSGDPASPEELVISYGEVSWEYRPVQTTQRSTPPPFSYTPHPR